MGSFLRRCRGAIGLGVTWAVAWGAIFAALVAVVAVVDPDSIDPGEGPLAVARIGAILLAVTERRKALLNLSLARAAVWGALGTAVFPLLTPVSNASLVFLCPIGAALAAGSVGLARKAEAAALPAPTPPVRRHG
jgi:hypothetical protein